jgi:sterol desaturase/sphingolipid hydroxylase (fatty acid hydroxylase superfamily)
MIGILLIVFFTLETFIPDITHFRNRKRHAARNLVLVFLCFMVNGIAAAWFGHWLVVIQDQQWGLLNILHLDGWGMAIVGLFLIDLDSYIMHVVFHKVSLLWRLHRVHHSDNKLDSTSSLRSHPLETVLQAMWRTVTFALLGMPFASFVLFYTVALPLLFIQHSNLRMPVWLENSLGALFVMSTWHRIHHSDEQRFTDSHYGNVFTIWDRIFGTSHSDVEVGRLTWGLKEFKEDEDQRVKRQLLSPFKSR